MKKMKRIKTLLLALLLGMTIVPALPAHAGNVISIIDTTTYKEELNESLWYNADGDITVQDGVIMFPDSSSANTKMISKTAMKPATQMDVMLQAKFTVNFTSLPEGEKMIFAIGLSSLMAEPGQAGNVELAFLNNGGSYKAFVSAYAEDSVEENLTQGVSCGKNSVKVAVEVSTKQTISITLNGKKIYSGSIPVSGEGSVGFIQTGSCGAKVSDFVLKYYDYDTPECPNFEEDFETGYFNSNLLYSYLLSGTNYSPSHMKIEDYKGSKVLMFKNTGIAYIGTQYAYSNFELTFDVPYFERIAQVDKNGETVQPKSLEFGLAYGSDGVIHTNENGYTTATDMFCISGPFGGYCYGSKEPMSSGIKDPTKEAPFCVRLTVIDGLVTLSMKLKSETTWHETVSYTLDQTPTGNVIIWAPTGSSTSFAIDNIKMVNKDLDGKVIDVEYKSSEIVVPEDFKYEPLGLDYDPKAVVNEDVQDTWYVPVVIVTGICLVSLGITATICIVRAKKRKAGTNNDK